MAYPDKHGKVWFKELQSLEQLKGIRDPRLDEAVPPEETAHIFYLYWNRFRSCGVTHNEIKAFQDVEGYELEPWEVDLLFTIHSHAESTISEIIKDNHKK